MTLATTAKDVKFYSWPSVNLLGVHETPPDCMTVKSISWNCDGNHLVILKSKGPPSLISAPRRVDAHLEPFLNLKPAISSAVFSNIKSSVIVFGTKDGTIHQFDYHRRKIIDDYLPVGKEIQMLKYSCDDGVLGVACASGDLHLYGRNLKPFATLMVPSSYSLSVVNFNKKVNNLLAASSREGVSCIWDINNSTALLISKEHIGIISDLTFIDDYLYTVGEDMKLIKYDLRMKAGHTDILNMDAPLSGVDILPNKIDLAVSTINGQLRSYDTRYMTAPLRTVVSYESKIKHIQFAPVASTQFAGSRDHEVYLHYQSSASGDYNDVRVLTIQSFIHSDPAETKNSTKDLNGSHHNLINSTATNGLHPNPYKKISRQNPNWKTSTDKLGESSLQSQNGFIHQNESRSDLDQNSSAYSLMNQNKLANPLDNILDKLHISDHDDLKLSLEQLGKLSHSLANHLKIARSQFQEKLLQNFYMLRIDASKNFIALEDKIDSSWVNFLNFMRQRSSSRALRPFSSFSCEDVGCSSVVLNDPEVME